MTRVNGRSSSHDIAGHTEQRQNTTPTRGKGSTTKDVADSLGMRDNKGDDARNESNGSASAKGFKFPKLPIRWPRCPDIIKPPIGGMPPIQVINPPVGFLPPVTVKPPHIPTPPPQPIKLPPGLPIRPELPIVLLPPGRGVKLPGGPSLPDVIAIPGPKEPPRKSPPRCGVEPLPPVRLSPLEAAAEIAARLSEAALRKK